MSLTDPVLTMKSSSTTDQMSTTGSTATTGSKARQRIAFLGPVASYTHQAALATFDVNENDFVAQINIRDVFDAVQDGIADKGVVPFENSTNGSVVFTLDYFADRENLFTDVAVCDEAYLDVHHYLLGQAGRPFPEIQAPSAQDTSRASTPTPAIPRPPQPRTRPRSHLGKIKRIYSHPQAFGQCEAFLGAYMKGVERVDVSSTSRAAEMVKEDGDGTSCAIASQVAASVHNLDVLAEGIEDREDNTTRFFVLRKGLDNPRSESAAQEDDRIRRKVQRPCCKTLVSFMVDHQSPGALADVLDCFRRYKLNLTSINSRPSRVKNFQYIFFVEFEGSKFDDPHGAVEGAMESLAKVAKSWRWLGSFEDRLVG